MGKFENVLNRSGKRVIVVSSREEEERHFCRVRPKKRKG